MTGFAKDDTYNFNTVRRDMIITGSLLTIVVITLLLSAAKLKLLHNECP
jgi:hypothetical protein